jgi:hypothetical protein
MRVLLWTLAVFGAIVLLFIFAVFGFGAVGAGKIAALSGEAARYADESIAAYAAAWDEATLLERASPELVSELARNPGALDKLSQTMDAQAGAFISAAPSICGKYGYSATTASGEVFTAECTSEGLVAKGVATFTASVVFRRKEWRLLGFFVNVEPNGERPATLVSIIEEADVHPVGLEAAFGERSIAVSPRNRSVTYAVRREKAPFVGVHANVAPTAPIE